MVVSTPTLHVPDEPTVRAEAWLQAVLTGRDLADVLTGDEGVSGWLWSRWSALRPAGVSRDDLDAIVLSYRRELWLWLAGERTWAQCCSGLIGRIDRRVGR